MTSYVLEHGAEGILPLRRLIEGASLRTLSYLTLTALLSFCLMMAT
ncbi:hypothetical protein [Vulcanisaeta distributa]|nr:hypothetical protein [Vulcanisaeta distributa]